MKFFHILTDILLIKIYLNSKVIIVRMNELSFKISKTQNIILSNSCLMNLMKV